MKPEFDVEGYIVGFGAAPIGRDEWAMTCPVCGREGKLVVNPDRGVWHCWICEEYRTKWDGKKMPVRGAGGIIALVEWLEGCSREQAKAIVESGSTGNYVADVSILGDFEEQTSPQTDGFCAIEPPPYWRPIVGNLPYCERRGITAEDVQNFGLVYCDMGRYRNRLVFPVWEGGKLLYFQARAMWDPRPGEKFVKSLNPEKVKGSAGATDVLMNLESARNYPRVAITEGPIDCIHAGLSAVCTFGKKISSTQILKLVHAGVKAIDLMWDGPTEEEPRGAWPQMLQAAAKLSGIFDVRLVFLPKGDPGDYTQDELWQFRETARSADSISRLAVL
jgi:hypothetical protein